MKRETAFSGFLYSIQPLLLFMLVSFGVEALMESVWIYAVRDRFLQGGTPAYWYAVSNAWNTLSLVIPAGTGALAIRRTAAAELSLFRPVPEKLPFRPGAGKKRKKFPQAYLPAVLLVSSIAFALGVNIVISLSGLSAGETPQASLPGPAGLLLQTAVYVFYMPFVEELLFRGTLFPRLERQYGLRTALLLSAILFGVYHGRPVQGIYAACMGILLAAVYAGTGRFVIPFALHGACNLSVLFLQWTGTYVSFCRPAWAAVFLGIAAAGFLTIQR